MNKKTDLEYLKLNKFQRFFYHFKNSFLSIPKKIKNLFIKLELAIKNLFLFLKNDFLDFIHTFKNGDYKTRISYFIMGFGNLFRGQILRGILFLLFQIIFIVYMSLYGFYYILKLPTLGEKASVIETIIDPVTGYEVQITTYYDNSFKILLYGILSLLFIIAFIYTYRINIKQNKLAQLYLKEKKKLPSSKDDLSSLLQDNFYKTLLSLPLLGIILFTILPILFMIFIAFTNYDINHTPPANLFTWVGLDNFNQLLNWSSEGINFSATFGEILSWTLIWAIFSTFTNYFLGMGVAMLINKKGIRLKKFWRTIFVATIAVPQFISLLYVSKMFANDGIVNGFLRNLGFNALPFFTNKNWARVMVILINIWIGIPYSMLIVTGILMNIPQDLYESAKIDGANPFQQYIKITLPYMLFITGPYLLTSFISNMNNFNVIYLLTGGAPTSTSLTGGAGYSDLLITWLYKLTIDNSDYKLAAVIGIIVFLVVSFISLIIYNFIPSIKNEEDYQ